jgi:hypothetical protein
MQYEIIEMLSVIAKLTSDSMLRCRMSTDDLRPIKKRLIIVMGNIRTG